MSSYGQYHASNETFKRRIDNTLTLKQIFRKTKTFFKKLEYQFLVESVKIENATFPYKNALSEANVKTNRMESTETDLSQKNAVLPVATLFFE